MALIEAVINFNMNVSAGPRRYPMRHVAKRFAVVLQLSLVGVALVAAHASGRGGQSPLMPPQSHAFGKSFEEWNVLYSQWVARVGARWKGRPERYGRARPLPPGPDPPTGSRRRRRSASSRRHAPSGHALRGVAFLRLGRDLTTIRPCPTTTRQTPFLDVRLRSRPPRISPRSVLDGRVLMAGTGTTSW